VKSCPYSCERLWKAQLHPVALTVGFTCQDYVKVPSSGTVIAATVISRKAVSLVNTNPRLTAFFASIIIACVVLVL